MPIIALVETPENNRGRFIADSVDAAIEELRQQYPVGASVADRLRRGERVVTDSYTLALLDLDTGRSHKQPSLF